MDFLRIIRSLEEFLYKVLTWLIFYPRTIWRVLRHPIEMLHYSDKELGDKPEQQYTDMISPPLFLMITIMIAHVIEISSHQALPKATSSIGREIVASDQNLLILQSILFAIYPLFFAISRLKRQSQQLNRDTLRKPFFAQCYIAAPAALTISIGSIFGRSHATELQIIGVAAGLSAVIWYLAIETIWLKHQTRVATPAAVWSVIKTWLAASFVNSIISLLILGT